MNLFKNAIWRTKKILKSNFSKVAVFAYDNSRSFYLNIFWFFLHLWLAKQFRIESKSFWKHCVPSTWSFSLLFFYLVQLNVAKKFNLRSTNAYFRKLSFDVNFFSLSLPSLLCFLGVQTLYFFLLSFFIFDLCVLVNVLFGSFSFLSSYEFWMVTVVCGFTIALVIPWRLPHTCCDFHSVEARLLFVYLCVLNPIRKATFFGTSWIILKK